MEQEVAVTALSSGAPGGAVAELPDAGAGDGPPGDRSAAAGRAAAYRPRALR